MATVEMGSSEEAIAAKNALNDYQIDDSRIKVDIIIDDGYKTSEQ